MSHKHRQRDAEYALRTALEAAHKEFAYQYINGEGRVLQGNPLTTLIGAVEEYLRVCDEPRRPGRPRMTKRAMAAKYPGILNRLHNERAVDLAVEYGVSRANVYLWRKHFPVEVQP